MIFKLKTISLLSLVLFSFTSFQQSAFAQSTACTSSLSQSSVLTSFADNTVGAITPRNVRDYVCSLAAGSIPFGTPAGSAYGITSIWMNNADPSLIHNAASGLSINGNSVASSLVMGIAATSPNEAWLQVRNWFSDNAPGPLVLQPKGGGLEIYTTNLSGGSLFDVQINDNWSSSTYFGPVFSGGFSGAVNLYSNSHGANGFQSVGRLTDITGVANILNYTSYCFSDVGGSSNDGCWAYYGEAHRMVNGSYVFGAEISAVNRESHVQEINPFNGAPTPPSGTGEIVGVQLDCGNSAPSTSYTLYSCGAGLIFTQNVGSGQTGTIGFAHGIVFRSPSLDSTLFSPPDAIALPANTSQYAMSFWSDGSHRAWLISSNATQTSTNNLLLANNLLQSDAPITSTVASGATDVQSLSGTVQMQMGANSSSALGWIGTISNNSWQLLQNNSEMGRMTSGGLQLSSGSLTLTTAASAPLVECFSGTCAGIWFSDKVNTTSQRFFFGADTAAADLFRIFSNNAGLNIIGISGVSGSVFLDVAGGSLGVNVSLYNAVPANTLYVNGSSSFNTTSTTASGINVGGTSAFAGTVTMPDSGTYSSTGINSSIIGGTTPAAGTFTTLRFNSSISANGSTGLTQTCTVNQAKTLIFTLGVLTGGTCNT